MNVEEASLAVKTESDRELKTLLTQRMVDDMSAEEMPWI